MNDVLWLDATSQAELVASGKISPRELAEAAIARIGAVDDELNAVIHQRFDKALAEIDAGLPTGPFFGVPFLVKDLFADTAGDPAHNGNQALRDIAWTATSDSWLTARFRRAGFAFLGRTNTPEFGLVPVTEPHAYGPTRNPFDTTRSPGGSSGGSAAAVAAGMVAVAHASDGGGSIRIPSSMCNLVGLKPSRGRSTLGPGGDESGPAVQHVVTRSVRDTAAVLDVAHGPGPGDMTVAPPPLRSYVEELSVRPTGLRIGMMAFNPAGKLHPDCEMAVRSAGNLLDSLGHDVSEDSPSINPDSAPRSAMRAVSTRLHLLRLGQVLGREVTPDDVEPLTWATASAADGLHAVDHAQAIGASARFTRQIAAFWNTHDLLLTPTLGEPPPLVGELEPPADNPFAIRARTASLIAFMGHFNVTGQPAISVPLHVNEAGLPIGVQLVAAYGREDLLIQVAAQLEEAAPWAARRPGAVDSPPASTPSSRR